MFGVGLAVALVCAIVVFGIVENQRRIDALAKAICGDSPGHTEAVSDLYAIDTDSDSVVAAAPYPYKQLPAADIAAQPGYDDSVIEADYDEIF